MKNEILTASDIITRAFSSIEKANLDKSNKLCNTWKKIITSIKSWNSDQNIGQNLYDHTTVIEVKNNILLVEADHPGWLQMLGFHKKYILNGLKMYVPELKINSLAFRLKGSNAQLYSVNYDSELRKEQQKLKEKLDNEQNLINSASDNKNDTTNELPDELKKIFDHMMKK